MCADQNGCTSTLVATKRPELSPCIKKKTEKYKEFVVLSVIE